MYAGETKMVHKMCAPFTVCTLSPVLTDKNISLASLDSYNPGPSCSKLC